MQSAERWLQFEISGGRYALPVDAVAQIVGLGELRPAGQPGWAGLLPLKGGTLPLADGAGLIGEEQARPGQRGRGLVLRGRLPLGFTADAVLGLTPGVACPLISRVGLTPLAAAALPSADRSAVVLDADRLWHLLRAGLDQGPDGRVRLRPLGVGARRKKPAVRKRAAGDRKRPAPARADSTSQPLAAPSEPTASAAPEPAGAAADSQPPAPNPPSGPLRVLVFRAGPAVELGVPGEQVLELGPPETPRPLPGGPRWVAGLLPWRGRLVPMVDLPSRLGCELPGPGRTLYLKLSGRAARAVAVRIGEVVGPALVPSLADQPPACGVPPAWIRGVARLGRVPLVVLDPAALVVD